MRVEDSHSAKVAQPAEGGGEAVDPVDVALPETFVPISVRDESPALGSAHCVALSSNNTVRPVLPQDPRRRRAVLLAVDNDVYLASSLETAQAAEGATTSTFAFYLPKSIPVPITSKAAFWAAASTTASTSRVSVLVEKDDD